FAQHHPISDRISTACRGHEAPCTIQELIVAACHTTRIRVTDQSPTSIHGIFPFSIALWCIRPRGKRNNSWLTLRKCLGQALDGRAERRAQRLASGGRRRGRRWKFRRTDARRDAGQEETFTECAEAA